MFRLALESVGVAAATLGLSYGLGMKLGASAPPAMPLDEMEDLLEVVEFVDLDDGQGGVVRTLRFSGVNLQIVNGEGSTESADGSGNLLIGYDELLPGTDHTGSHNVVVGSQNEYTSYGGLIAGRANSITAPYATVCGGRGNRATAAYSVAAGGRQNLASGEYAGAFGGRRNQAAGSYSVAVGGGSEQPLEGNQAGGDYSVCAGGRANQSPGSWSTVIGGWENSSVGEASLIGGGQSNLTEGMASAILGGENRAAEEDHAVLADGAGAADNDWQETNVDGIQALVAGAPRVGIGTDKPTAALEVVPTAGVDLAMDLAGDLSIGSPDTPKDASEYIEFRNPGLGSWYLGVQNGPELERAPFFISRTLSNDGTLSLDDEGRMGLGTASPEAALHIVRNQSAEVVLEGGDSADGHHAGLRFVQDGGALQGQVGLYEGALVFRHSDDSKTGLVLEPDQSSCLVQGGLEVTGNTVLKQSLTVEGNSGFGGDVVVAGDLTVNGDLATVQGDLVVNGDVSPGLWNGLRPFAWGECSLEGERVEGSTNWSCEYVPLAGNYLITFLSDPQDHLLFIVNEIETEGAFGRPITVGTPDTVPSLADNQITVTIHGIAGGVGPFNFLALEY